METTIACWQAVKCVLCGQISFSGMFDDCEHPNRDSDFGCLICRVHLMWEATTNCVCGSLGGFDGAS